MTSVRQVLAAGNTLGESPLWSPTDGVLWWVNCEHPAELLRWVQGEEAPRRWAMPQRIGGFALRPGGGILVALADGINDYALEADALALHARSPLSSQILLHESQVDRRGRLWIGGFDQGFPADRNAAGAAYCRLDGDRLVPAIEGIGVANGLAFSPDGRTIYAGDSAARTVWAFDLDPDSGAVSNRRPFVKLEPGYGHLDGATCDAEGGYWLAIVGVGALRRYNPDGTLEREIAMPCTNPTKPAFGGPDMATIYVTSTTMQIGVPTARDRANGALFALEPGFRGVAEVPLAA